MNDSEQVDHRWIIGVILAAVASALSNLGVNLQKLSHLRLERRAQQALLQYRTRDRPQYYQSPIWMGGIVLVIVGSLCDFAALGFGSQSLVAPLGSLTLVANCIFAPLL